VKKSIWQKHLILMLFITFCSHAQVGIGTTVPNAALDITSTNDGLLIPRVALINTTTVTVVTGTTSELVYNTVTSGDVTPGFYYLSSATGPWIRVATGGSGWQITGNTDIVDNVNFIGTAAGNNVDVAFRRNNFAAGKIALTSTSFGVGALNAGATSNSSAFGTNALTLNTGEDNVAVGNGSLSANTTGTDNVAVGNNTLATNTTGIQNTGVGNNVLRLNSGIANSALGLDALRTNTTGANNTGIGFQALQSNTTASNNTGIGFQALRANSIGTSNTAVGFQSGENTTASSNTSVEFQAHQMNTIGFQNVAIGERSLGRNSGSQNTVIGWEAMFGATSNASNSTALGWHALFNNSGANNTAIGHNALQGNTSAAENTAVGAGSLNNNSAGSRNTAVGRNAGFATNTNDGTFVGFNSGRFSTGTENTAMGANALDANGASARSVAIGYNALTNSTAANNTALGHSALNNLATGTGNVALGYQAGFAETTSNKLYISNSNTTPITSLIYGEFAPTRILRTNSLFQIGDPIGTGYQFPVARGTNNQVLQTNTTGVLSWVDPSSLTITEVDPQVSSVAANAVPKWGGTTLVDGIITDNGTSVNIAGNTTTSTFQMTTGANANYILQSDATGNASWVQNPLTTLSAMRINLSANQALGTAGWQKINFDTTVFDTKSEFAGGRFTAATAGIYQVNAGMHTNDQSNGEFYSIGVYINGALYQETTGNHFGNGPVHRNINCMVNLAAGGFVEIYVQNYQNGVQADRFPTKTFFEVAQIR
jgi:hypothetical protein